MKYTQFFITIFTVCSLTSSARSSLPSLTWHLIDDTLIVSIDTFKTIHPDSVHITHTDNQVLVQFVQADCACSLTLYSTSNALSLGLCAKQESRTEKNREQGLEEVYEEYRYGSVCTKEVIPVSVDFDHLKAEYGTTALFLKMPLIKKISSRKIALTKLPPEESLQQVVKKPKKKHRIEKHRIEQNSDEK